MEGKELIKVGKNKLDITTSDNNILSVEEITYVDDIELKGRRLEFISEEEIVDFSINIGKIKKVELQKDIGELVWY